MRTSVQRRAGAPRLIDWTGERCVPWAPDVPVVYEHFHRYLWAARIVPGRTVLEVASGEGFGASILAASAAAVVGVDIDERAVAHSRLNYAAENLTFEVTDARDLSQFAADSFDAVVAFEMIEHVHDQETVLSEISRVLSADGILIISTPDRGAYSDATGQNNPFHARELNEREFTELLEAEFSHVARWGQRLVTGSAMSPLPTADGSKSSSGGLFVIQRSGDDWLVDEAISPVYIIAVASNAELPEIMGDSALVDGGLELLKQARLSEANALTEVTRLGDDLHRALVEIGNQRHEAERVYAHVASQHEEIKRLAADLAVAQQFRCRVEGSVVWQVVQRIRAIVFEFLGGETSRPVRSLQAALRFIGRTPSVNGPRAEDSRRQ